MDPLDQSFETPKPVIKTTDYKILDASKGISPALHQIPPSEPATVPPPPMMRLGKGFASLIPDLESQSQRWVWQLREWPEFHWDMGDLASALAAARQAQGRLQMAGRVLAPSLTRDALAQVLKDEGMSTSAIEGESLNPESLSASIARHLGIPWDRTPDTRDVDGLISVLRGATERREEPLSLQALCAWQAELFPCGRSQDLHKITTGSLRPEEVIVAHGPYGRETVDFAGVPREHLEPQIDRFIEWFNTSRDNMDGLIRAGQTHLWFVTLHPFDDGNGRIARALTDMAIAQDWGPSECLFRMSYQILAVRKDYYGALQNAQSAESGMDTTQWLKWFLTQVAAACRHAEQTIMHVLAKARFWAEHRENVNDRQRKVLNVLLDTKPGEYKGGMTTKKYAIIAECPNITASRDLSDLVEKGCLEPLMREEKEEDGRLSVRPLGGRSSAYDVPWSRLLV